MGVEPFPLRGRHGAVAIKAAAWRAVRAKPELSKEEILRHCEAAVPGATIDEVIAALAALLAEINSRSLPGVRAR